MNGQIVEAPFATGPEDQEVHVVHLGPQLARQLEARTGEQLRVWTGSAQQRERSAVAVVGQVGGDATVHLRLAPRLQAILGARDGRTVFVQGVELGAL